jgi:hypothetical protein
MEQEIVKVPKNQITVALGLSKAAVAAGIDLERSAIAAGREAPSAGKRPAD